MPTDQRVVFVTGAGRRGGLGEGIAARFAQDGCKVVLADLGHVEGSRFPAHGVATTEEMEAVASGLREATPSAEVRTVVCDVRSEASVVAAVEYAVGEFGGIDVLVNNAGIGYLMALVTDMEEQDWDAVLDVNLKGAFLCTKHATRRMIARGRGGRIVNIASQAAKTGFPYATAYTSSKHGLIGFTRAAAIELAPHGITVNAVCPNHVTTGLGAWQNRFFSQALGKSEDDYLAAMRSRIPMGRPGLPDDTAKACAFLAGADADYITGEALNVSGGEEMH
jgi:NAD(P)-dependent dehydrogenase (short-subunit alcohol dehydrogenase family)